MSAPDPWDRGEPSIEELQRFVDAFAANRLPHVSAKEFMEAYCSVPPGEQLSFMACVAWPPGTWRIEFHPTVSRAIEQVPGAAEVFHSQMVLGYLGAPPEEFERRREKLRRFLPPGFLPGAAAEALDRQLHLCAGIASAHLGHLDRMGFRFNFDNDKKVVTIPSGGAPSLLVNTLVKALAREIQKERPPAGRANAVARMAAVLRPVFGAELASTESKGRIAQAWDNSYL